ncbi:MAG: lysylphosphatidylglycerol synthase transmembrane domain-containing protein [Halobacteriales archaeon]|nr:lysylphosphatidylglycerol synthase transmembrane domain-containing protein [Halobacteriales archaeon]
MLFRRAIGTDFETGLAAIGSLNALNRVAAVVLGLLGVGYLGSRVTVGGALRNAAVLVTGLSIVVSLGLVVGWRYRHRLVSVLASVLTPLLRGGARLVPRVAPPTREGIERRGYRFVGAIDRLASDPRRLAVVFTLSIAGQLAVAASLWLSLAVLGFDAPLAIVLLIIPIGKLAGIAPTPGRFGSSEALLAVLLISTTGVSRPIAGAAVLLYRAGAFWVPSLVGGLVTGWFVVMGSRTAPDGSRSVHGGHDGTFASDGDESITTPAPSTVPRILITLSVSLAVLVTVVMHRSHLVVEPNSIVVHAIRDTSLVVLSLVLTWAMLHRLPRGWVG